jgi:hypothetical protein
VINPTFKLGIVIGAAAAILGYTPKSLGTLGLTILLLALAARRWGS